MDPAHKQFSDLSTIAPYVQHHKASTSANSSFQFLRKLHPLLHPNGRPLPSSPEESTHLLQRSFPPVTHSHYCPLSLSLPGETQLNMFFPAPRTPIRYYPSAPIEPYVASSTTHAKRHLASQIDHTFHEAAGDGNCLLNAFLMGLQIQTTMYDPTLHTPDNLRHEIFNFLNTPQGLGLREQNHMTDRELLEILPVPGQRPTHLEHASATALSLLFQLNINIYCLWYSNNSYSTDSFLHIAQATAPTITLIHHYNHYDYLQPSQAAPD